MDYEKKYKEALERAKKFYNELAACRTKQKVAAIFPELAESEDERVRKSIIHILQVGGYMPPEEKDKAFAYLEKQKELPFVKDVILGYPGLYFYDGERMHFQGNPAMEEKQKEQKPAEQDGPFNEDEFLENELSAFLQNYDKEYDDDAAVSDVARHFYEIGKKQKEQKPVEIHIDNPNIEKFDPDMKITISDSSADGDELLYVCNKSYKIDYRDGKRDAEQKPVKYLDKDKVYAIMNKLTELSTSDLIPIESEEYVKIHEITSDVCSLLNYPIEQKPAEWSEEDEKTINNACCWIAEYAGYLMDKNYSKASMLMSLTDKLKSLRPQPHCKISDELDTDTLRDWSMRFAPDIREEIESTAYHFYNLGSQPKQEWSDEDKAILEWCIADIERAKSHPSQTKPELCDIEINWLKALNLKKRNEDVAKLYSNEWSEEDAMLMDELESYILYDKEFNDEQKSWRIKRLKSFRPQPKVEWSDEDEKNLRQCIEIVRGWEVDYANAEPRYSNWLMNWLMNRLKYLRPQPNTVSVENTIKFGNLEYERGVKDGIQHSENHHWKPSEEQMQALEYVIRDYREDSCNATANYLQEILDHLKNM